MNSGSKLLIFTLWFSLLCTVQQCGGSGDSLKTKSDVYETARAVDGGDGGRVGAADGAGAGGPTGADGDRQDEAQVIPAQVMYRHLLRQKRIAHREAVKTILQLQDYEKQHKMVTLLLDKLFKIVTEAKVKLISSGFTPGDPFPTNESTKDAFSSVVENTAFFGDMLLRLPDVVHDILKRKREWDLIVKWSVGFCDASKIFEDKEASLLHLMSQELGIIDKEEDYINPYKQQKLNKDHTAEFSKEAQKKQRAKKRKERKRGPRLSGHTEL